MNRIAEDEEFYHVRSNSDPNKVYIIAKNDFDGTHKDCLAFRFRGDCSHIKAIKKFAKGKKLKI